MIILTTLIICFFCGSIPTGYLITKKVLGIDIRSAGSGNIGSTNVRRIAGNKLSILTQAMDVLKGLIPVLVGIYITKYIELPVSRNLYLSIIALAVILGHDFTPFLSFKGGKGVNATVGAFILIAPIPTIIAVVVHFLLRLITKIVSIRSIAIGVTIPLGCMIMGFDRSIIAASIISGVLIIYCHKDNLHRMIAGKEI